MALSCCCLLRRQFDPERSLEQRDWRVSKNTFEIRHRVRATSVKDCKRWRLCDNAGSMRPTEAQSAARAFFSAWSRLLPV